MRTKRTVFAFAVFAVFAFFVVGSAQQRRPQDVDLQAAIRAEVVDGDLSGAIKQYQAIVSKYKTDRAIAATALVHMAECFQKRGDAQAKPIYEQLVREYADQKDVVAIARARLDSGRSIESGRLSARRVWDGDTQGMISVDGRYLTYVDKDGRLAIHDFSKRVDRLLTSETGWYSFPQAPVLSNDSQQIAYAWLNNDTGRYELRVASVPAAGVVRSRVLLSAPDIEYAEPCAWSPDGSRIAVDVSRTDRTAQIALLSVEDGTLTPLRTTDWRGATRIFFSPDGRYLAYDLPESEATSDRDVHVLAVDGSRGTRIVASPGRDVVMGWSPDGRYVLFATDRNGGTGLWAVAVEKGLASGAPVRLKEPIESEWSLGVTNAGALYVGRSTSGRDINVATVDFESGSRVAATNTPVDSHTGTNRWLDWSRDGKYLAYVSERGVGVRPVTNEQVIGIRSGDSGALVRELRPSGFRYFQWLSWSPDARRFAVGGRDLKGRDGVFSIDAQTGDVAELYRPVRSFGAFRPEWSPDGASLYFFAPREPEFRNGEELALVAYDVASRRTRELLRTPEYLLVNLSPDGRTIALGKNNGESSSIVLVSTATGETRTLLSARKPQSFSRGIGWSPDSRGVVVRKALNDDAAELWWVPVDGGEPRKLEVDVNQMGPLSPIRVHPDGKRLAFFAFVPNPISEVWAVENFLPK